MKAVCPLVLDSLFFWWRHNSHSRPQMVTGLRPSPSAYNCLHLYMFPDSLGFFLINFFFPLWAILNYFLHYSGTLMPRIKS